MNEIRFKIPIKAIAKVYQMFLTKCQNPGPRSVQCECGEYFSGWFKQDGNDITAFSQIVKDSAAKAMEQAGILKPLTGPVELWAVMMCERPQSHYEQGDRGNPVKQSFLHDPGPTGSPNAIGVLDALQHILAGTAYIDRRQIAFPSAPKQWADSNSIQITIRPYRASSWDPRNKQLELF